ncbi:DUF190 domain-containing protein [Hellea balneolensis]|uniref:DUF190 domain-containing protein n=1 Tax=Hellea balneolensis TaxID=287478 RepID=UPI000479CA81|nr:DUF190 domain-containing protein [Hellea balneolensis]
MHQKKRLEIIIEKPALKRACRVLEEAGVKGYTVFPAMAGFGNSMRWQRGTDLSASRDMVMIISILDAAVVTKATEDLENLMGAHIAVLSLSDVQVLRAEKF